MELKEIEVLGEISRIQKILLHVGFFSRTLDVEKAVDVASVMIFEMRRGDAITVVHLTILHPNVTKGMEVGFRQKANKSQKTPSREDLSPGGAKPEAQSNPNKESMSSILEEANRLLKSMGGSENVDASSTTSKTATCPTTTTSGDQDREDMMEKLQQQLNALRQKTLRVSVSRMSGGGMRGLIDSGATHPLRPLRAGEDQRSFKRLMSL